MAFSITILGSGASMPTGHRYCSSQVVNIEGFKLLIDAGENVQNQIRRSHVKMQSVGTILISHLHGDHFFGLPGLLSTMHLCGRTEPINLFAPKGLQEILSLMFKYSNTELNFEINYHELQPSDIPTLIFENQKCKIYSFPIYHSVETYGFIIEEQPAKLLSLKRNVAKTYSLTPNEILSLKNANNLLRPDGTNIPYTELTQPPKKVRRYAYCCDTSYNEKLLPILKDVDMLCFDCTFDAQNENLASEKGHGTTRQAAILAKQANVETLLLSHFSARFKDLTPLLNEATEIFQNTILAEDLQVLEITQKYQIATN